jgi:putative transposase
VNHKRVQRLYREEKLTVRRRGGRKRALGERRPLERHRHINRKRSRLNEMRGLKGHYAAFRA